MTASPPRPPLAFATKDEALAAVRAAGCRISAARRALLDTLFAARGPVTAEQIAAGLDGRAPPADLAATYRNLELLERLGVVRHLHAGHGPGLYALAGGGDREYLVCERCGRVETLDPSRLEDVRAEVRRRFSFTPRFSHFPMAGLCAACEEQLGTDA